MTTRTAALLLSSAVSVAFSLTGFAEPAPAPAPAAAAPAAAASDDNGIAEIVVTAEKRNESLETVPVAISAYTSKTRDLLGINTIQDMTNSRPVWRIPRPWIAPSSAASGGKPTIFPRTRASPPTRTASITRA